MKFIFVYEYETELSCAIFSKCKSWTSAVSVTASAQRILLFTVQIKHDELSLFCLICSTSWITAKLVTIAKRIDRSKLNFIGGILP